MPRRRLRPARPPRRRSAARPLDRFYTRVNGDVVELGPRFSVNSELRRFSPRDPGEPLDGIGQYLYPSRPDAQKSSRTAREHHAKLPAPPLPSALKTPPPRPGEDNGKAGPLEDAAEAGITVVDWVDERTSLSGAARWLMFRKVPKGTNWFYTLGSATMFAFLTQAVTGVFLAMYYRPDPPAAPTNRSATSPTKCSSGSSCAACTSGARA